MIGPDLLPRLRAVAAMLPTCPFHALTGLPCPTCGTTRGVLALVDGRPLDAIAMNPLVFIGGVCLVSYIAVGMAVYARTGRFPEPTFSPRGLVFARVLAGAVLALNWIYLIARGV